MTNEATDELAPGSKLISEEKMYEQNRELNQNLLIESLSVGDKLYHILYRDIWTVTKISVKFTDFFNGTPKVLVELHNEKTKQYQRYAFPSAHSVFDFAMLKELAGRR